MTMTPRPDACRAGATALSHSAACGGGLYALTSTGGCASCTCRAAAVTFGRGALMSLPTPPNERLSLTEPSGALASCASGLAATRPMTSTPTNRRGCAGRRTIGLMDRLVAADGVAEERLKAARLLWATA